MNAEPPITLERLAGITAALAEKLPLADVLAQEQVAEADFREAQPIWRQRIAESMVTQLEYTEKLRVAEDCLARKLAPVEDDPAAWAGLLAALATSLDQAELLGRLGITMTDVGRLGRLWKRRMQADPALAAQLAELARNPTPPTEVQAGRVELRPFPWTPKTPAPTNAPTPADVAEPEAPPTLGRHVPVQRVLASFQMLEASAGGPPAVEASHERIDDAGSFASWTVDQYAELAIALRSNPTDEVMLRAGLATPQRRQMLHEHFRRRFESEPGLREAFGARLAAQTAPPAAESAEGDAPRNATMAPRARPFATMPFKKAATDSAEKPPVARRVKKATERMSPPRSRRAHSAPEASALPPAPEASRVAMAAPAHATLSDARASDSETPSFDATPKRGSSGGAPQDLGSTNPLDAGRARPGPTLPFAARKQARPGSAEPSGDDPELVRFAQLTLALASSEDRGAVLRRFELTEAGRKALSEAWGARFAADASLRRRFNDIIRRLKPGAPADG